jgi:hypothetical protein
MSLDKILLGALRIEWDVVGSVKLDEKGKIAFPKLPSKAGLYKFRVEKIDGSFGRYVGETDNLNRRFGHYRNPGPTQATNLRLNALFKELLRRGETIEVAIVTDRVWILRNNRDEVADLSDKSMRRLFENFVLVMDKARDVEDLNK